MSTSILFPSLRMVFNTLLLLIIISSWSNLLTAQSDTSWHRHYVMDSFEIMSPAGLEQCGNDAVVFIMASPPSNIQPLNTSALLRIDGENGDILWQTRLAHNPVAEASQIYFFKKGLIRLRDGSFIVLVDTKTESGDVGFALHRIADNGALLWHKDFGTPGEDILANGAGLGIGPDSMSFVVTARRLDIENPSSSLVLYYIDQGGEILNHLDLDTGIQYYSQLSPVAVLADSSFVVSLNHGFLDLHAPKWLRHISYTGQTLRTHAAWDFGWWSDLQRHPSGNIVAVSQAFTGTWENREKHGMRTTMYGPNLDTIWSKVYNHFDGPFYYDEIDFPGPVSFDEEGNILVSGNGSAYGKVTPAHLIMYNTNGNPKWVKRIGVGEDVGGYLQYIYGKIAFQHNGILLVGSNILNGMLLIRLDSIGCAIQPECNIDILLDTEEESEVTYLAFQLSPNPATDEVAVSLSVDNFQLLKKPRIHLVDMTGRVVTSYSLNDENQQLNLTYIPKGIYIAMLESSGRMVGIQKLVIW